MYGPFANLQFVFQCYSFSSHRHHASDLVVFRSSNKLMNGSNPFLVSIETNMIIRTLTKKRNAASTNPKQSKFKTTLDTWMELVTLGRLVAHEERVLVVNNDICGAPEHLWFPSCLTETSQECALIIKRLNPVCGVRDENLIERVHGNVQWRCELTVR